MVRSSVRKQASNARCRRRRQETRGTKITWGTDVRLQYGGRVPSGKKEKKKNMTPNAEERSRDEEQQDETKRTRPQSRAYQ
jgi:hypothetical protein